MGMPNDVQAGFFLPGVLFTTRGIVGNTANAGELSGGPLMVFNASAANPATYTTRTAAQMIADSSLVLGSTWWVLIVNGQTTGTLTLAGGSGVTVGGTATVAPNTARLYLAQVTGTGGSAAITFTGQAWSFTATALAFGV